MGSRSMMPPDSISKLEVKGLGVDKAVEETVKARGAISRRGSGMRSITPPRSISETPAHIVAHSETPLATSAAVKRDPPGMMRGVTPAKGVSTANLYGGHAPPSTHTEAGKSRQGRTGRSILPPAPFANEFGGSAYDSSAMMMQHAKVAHDMTKDPEPTREHLYGMDAIKAHAIEQPSHATPAGNRRSISPPKSISEHPSNGTVGNSLMASQKVDRDVIGNRRQVTPPPGVSAANHYGESVKSPQGLEKDAQTIGSPNHRQITPPPAINLAGSGVVDGGAFMEQHVKAVSEMVKTPTGGKMSGRPTTFSMEKVEKAEAEE